MSNTQNLRVRLRLLGWESILHWGRYHGFKEGTVQKIVSRHWEQWPREKSRFQKESITYRILDGLDRTVKEGIMPADIRKLVESGCIIQTG